MQAKDDTVHPRRFTLLCLVATLNSALAGTNITSVVVRSLVLTPGFASLESPALLVASPPMLSTELAGAPPSAGSLHLSGPPNQRGR